MGARRILAQARRSRCQPRPRVRAAILEIGCGDGRLLLRLARQPRRTLDRSSTRRCSTAEPIVDADDGSPRFARCGLDARGRRGRRRSTGLAQPTARASGTSSFANLFLHHFDAERLARLLGGIARRADAFVCCEPRRARFALAGSRLIGLHRLQRRHAPRRRGQRARRLPRRRARRGVARRGRERLALERVRRPARSAISSSRGAMSKRRSTRWSIGGGAAGSTAAILLAARAGPSRWSRSARSRGARFAASASRRRTSRCSTRSASATSSARWPARRSCGSGSMCGEDELYADAAASARRSAVGAARSAASGSTPAARATRPSAAQRVYQPWSVVDRRAPRRRASRARSRRIARASRRSRRRDGADRRARLVGAVAVRRDAGARRAARRATCSRSRRTSCAPTSLPTLLPVLSFDGGYGGMVVADDGIATLAVLRPRDRLQATRARPAGRPRRNRRRGDATARVRGRRRALDGAERAGTWLSVRSAPSGTCDSAGASAEAFTVGNAAGEAHPIVGEGISMAMQGAFLLCGASRPSVTRCFRARRQERTARHYERDWRRAFGARIRWAALFAALAMRPAARALLPALKAWPGLLTAGAVVGGKVRAAPVASLTTGAGPSGRSARGSHAKVASAPAAQR